MILKTIENAVREGKLLESAGSSIKEWMDGGFLPEWAETSIHQLADRGEFEELNDRFYQYMEFGTGGMRGRTIGRVSAEPEKGTGGTPAHAAVGSNVLNDFNIARATIGLFRHAETYLRQQNRFETPRLVIAHDVRHFSRHFCELAASVWTKLGGQAFIFDGPRSTPQLSFSVRRLRATVGIVITASHNPPHDNGYKVYFEDGGQVVEPHAGGIIAEVNKVALKELPRFLETDSSRTVILPEWMDEAYRDAAASVVLDPGVFKKNPVKAVFSPIHGTGGIQTVPLMERLGINFATVEEQMRQDPAFPSVKSPNPENAEALSMAMELADKNGADVVAATDPDCDRTGVAVRNADGALELLTGNQIGSLLAEYRITKLKETGRLPAEGSPNAALIKTFVTTEMQAVIGRRHGLKVINTLTGFKWIGEKIRLWEEKLAQNLLREKGIALNYDRTTARTRSRLLLEHSTWYVFGGEESYGYLADDLVRDKDGSAAVLMFLEMAAAAKGRGQTVPDYLDSLYVKYGYFSESVGQIYYEGAAGAARIKTILESYRARPPKEIEGTKVTRFTDFGREEIRDAEGAKIPPQNFYIFELNNGCSVAVRGSGTEPKIKFYLFSRADVKDLQSLPEVKASTRKTLEALRQAVEKDAAARGET